MSGIAGIIRFDGGPVEPGLIEKMTGAMAYRGPDGINHWIKGSVALGQCMLRTTPESLEETQPLANEDESLVLVMDGWLSNWEELRGELLSKGARLRTRADAELVLRAYEVWGRNCLPHIDGDFAFVIWDARKREAFCARDRMGNKPFCYHWTGKALIFCSDLRPVLDAPSVPQDPNMGMVADMLAVDWRSRDETIWTAVKRLVAARTMTVGSGGPQISQYWSVPLHKDIIYKRDEDYFAHYRELLNDCVRRTSRGHRPIACEVSGGLDSSAIFSVAVNLRNSGGLPAPDVKGYTYYFNDKSDADELSYAREVGRFLDTEIAEVPPFAPQLTWFEERYHQDRDLSCYPNGAMAVSLRQKMVADGCRVVLNGEGGDEWLAGRRLYYAEQLGKGQWRELAKSFGDDVAAFGLIQPMAWLVRHGLVHFIPRPIKEAGRGLTVPDGPNNHDGAFWLSEDMRAILAQRRASTERPYLKVPNLARRAMFMLLNDAFAIHGRELMALTSSRAGMETRTPMYDRQFIEFAFATPERLKIRGNMRKFVHVRAMEGGLPDRLLERKTKADFSVAFWWQLDRMQALLVDSWSSRRADLLNAAGMGKLYGLYQSRSTAEVPIWELWSVYACCCALES